jgi:adenine-specific DNA methylase
MPQTAIRRSVKAEANKLLPEDRPAHDWYRFVLSYPPHLVRDYVQRFGLTSKQCVLDPFCGTGTTVVECKKLGVPSVGIEANPMAHFASSQKVNWRGKADRLLEHAEQTAEMARERLLEDGIEDDDLPLFGKVGRKSLRELRKLPKEAESLILTNSISPLPLHKTLVLLDCLRENSDEALQGDELLALAKAVVFGISNLHFGPEVGVAI